MDIKILSYAAGDRPGIIHSVKVDESVFTIGDLITNEEGMRGNITRFEQGEHTIHVYTTWSGIGFGIVQAMHVQALPSRCQLHDQVYFTLSQNEYVTNGIGPKKLHAYRAAANVRGVHFYPGKVKYDLEIPMGDDDSPTRVYNIDSSFVEPVKS